MMAVFVYGLHMERCLEKTSINLCISYDLRTSSSCASGPPARGALHILFVFPTSHLALSDNAHQSQAAATRQLI